MNKKWMTFDAGGVVTYEYDSFLLGRTTLSTNHYELLSPQQVKIGSTTYTIRFTTSDMLVFDPAIHGEENWF